MKRRASACHPWPKTRRTLMIGWYNYGAFALIGALGLSLLVAAYLLDFVELKKSGPVIAAVASRLRLHRGAVSFVGFGMLVIGGMLIVSMYAERHSASSDVIFIPEFMVNGILTGATTLIVIGVIGIVVKLMKMKKAAKQVQSAGFPAEVQRVGADT